MRTKETPAQERDSRVRDHAYDGDSKATVELEDGKAIEGAYGRCMSVGIGCTFIIDITKRMYEGRPNGSRSLVQVSCVEGHPNPDHF